ncbi:hypothetical protein LP420_40275 [Massilia sp. B-10]|nr:hypothetical protein LP420_40275 [Massilia sp. B-10]UUZ54409.1 hypothetical protein LP419_39680 [Massilia sp. H-1]
MTTRSNAYSRTDTNTTIAVAISGVGGSNSRTDLDTTNQITITDSFVKGRDVNLYA